MSKSSARVFETTNYRLFHSNKHDNRPLDLRKHKKLEKSMLKYGFLKCFPIVCFRGTSGDLEVKDGQHRLAFAVKHQLPVYWIEDEANFDVAEINCTSKIWSVADYARKFSENGLRDYAEGLAFAEQHGLAIGLSFAMLAGTTSFGNIKGDFEDGKFKVKDRAWADAVATLYIHTGAMSPEVRNARFLEACMMVCRVDGFDHRRFIDGAKRCRDKLTSFSTKDAYLFMMEEIYNFGRKQLVGLKAAALMAMRERNAVNSNGKKKKDAV